VTPTKHRASRSSDESPPVTRGSEEAPEVRPEVSRLSKTLERIAIVIVSLVVAIGAIVLLSGFFTSRDQGGVSGTLSGPGIAYRDLGDAQLTPGHARPKYDSNPPTSGPHVPTPVRSDEAVLTDDEILTALGAGDVVLIYGGATPPPGLAQLARSTAGPFTPALAAAGQAVILARLPGLDGIIALAWTRMLPITGVVSVTGRNDAVLKQFIQAWLGQGAAGAASGNN
jgi:Protein of unknown function (DUF3105)